MEKARELVTADLDTPQHYVASHPITMELTKRGVTGEQLAAVRFREKDRRRYPFDQWSCTWGSGLPLEVIPFLKA